MSRYKAGWCFQEEGCSECLEVCSLVWGYLFFWRAGRTVVVIRWVVLDRTEHLILAVKCIVIEVIIALFLSGQVSGPCHFQLVLSPVILRGKISLKSLFFNPFALHLDLQVILLFHYWIDDSRSYYLCAKASFKKKKKNKTPTTSPYPLLTCFLLFGVAYWLLSIQCLRNAFSMKVECYEPQYLLGLLHSCRVLSHPAFLS